MSINLWLQCNLILHLSAFQRHPDFFSVPFVLQSSTLTKSQSDFIYRTGKRSKRYANLKMTTAITANALKKISFMHSSTFWVPSSLGLSLFKFLLTLLMVYLNLLTAQESQTKLKPKPVFNTLVIQKGTLWLANWYMTEKRTARPVPAIPADNWVRNWVISGPDFFSECTAVLLTFSSAMKVRRLSQALK